MEKYTEEQLRQAIQYACEYQKACDYQTAGGILMADGYKTTEQDIKLLDALASSIVEADEITIEEIFEVNK